MTSSMHVTHSSKFSTVILAAGKGKRMGSALPKVLCEVGRRSLLSHVVLAAEKAGTSEIALVVNNESDAIILTEAKSNLEPDFAITSVVQNLQNGTGSAAKLAVNSLYHSQDKSKFSKTVILNGDVALISPDTIKNLSKIVDNKTVDLALLAFKHDKPTGYGRTIINDQGNCIAIIEDKDLNPQQHKINSCYAGAMAIGKKAAPLLDKIGNNNAQQEYYLTEIVKLANNSGFNCKVVWCDYTEAIGANNPAELASVEAIIQNQLRSKFLAAGVRMIAPETVWFAANTKIQAGVEIEPNVVFGKNVEISSGAKIRSFSWLEGCTVGKNAEIGPFARIRAGSKLGENVRIGNFVETKASIIADSTKVNHLSYIGDATVGKGSNIGAGTITCNYDGKNKHKTNIGDGVFVGSNTSLVAPIQIGEGSYIGSGSVITKNVSPDALAVERSKQVEIAEWAAKKRNKDKNS